MDKDLVNAIIDLAIKVLKMQDFFDTNKGKTNNEHFFKEQLENVHIAMENKVKEIAKLWANKDPEEINKKNEKADIFRHNLKTLSIVIEIQWRKYNTDAIKKLKNVWNALEEMINCLFIDWNDFVENENNQIIQKEGIVVTLLYHGFVHGFLMYKDLNSPNKTKVIQLCNDLKLHPKRIRPNFPGFKKQETVYIKEKIDPKNRSASKNLTNKFRSYRFSTNKPLYSYILRPRSKEFKLQNLKYKNNEVIRNDEAIRNEKLKNATFEGIIQSLSRNKNIKKEYIEKLRKNLIKN